MLYVTVTNPGQIEERSKSINLLFAELTCELSNNRIKEIKLSYQVFADVLHLVFHIGLELELLARYRCSIY